MIRSLISCLLVLCSIVAVAPAQSFKTLLDNAATVNSGLARAIHNGVAYVATTNQLPAKCTPASASLYVITGTPATVEECTAKDTWTAITIPAVALVATAPITYDSGTNTVACTVCLANNAAVLGTNGTQAAPAYSFTAQPTTGMFRDASGVLSFTRPYNSAVQSDPAYQFFADATHKLTLQTNWGGSGVGVWAIAGIDELVLPSSIVLSQLTLFNANIVPNSAGSSDVGSGAAGFKSLYLNGIAFASLGGVTNGRLKYCSDCTKTTPCAGSGTGAMAKGLNGAWDCN